MRHKTPATSFKPQEEESKEDTYDAEDARYEQVSTKELHYEEQ